MLTDFVRVMIESIESIELNRLNVVFSLLIMNASDCNLFFQMDSSSTPNRGNLDNDKAVDGDEVEVFMTPDSRSKGKGKRRESPGASEETYQQKKSPRVLPTRSKIWNHFTRTK